MPSFRRTRARFLAVVPILALAGCAAYGGRQPESGAPASLWGTSWRLEDLCGGGIVDRSMATLEFGDEGRVAGRGSCNRFSGPATLAGTSITFGPLAVTRMACAEALDNQEARYLEALQNAERFARDGDALLIYCKGNEKPLRFMPAEP